MQPATAVAPGCPCLGGKIIVVLLEPQVQP